MLQFVAAIVLYGVGCLVMALALYPGILLTKWMWDAGAALEPSLRLFLIALGIALGYFLYGLSLVILIPTLRLLLNLRLKPGEYDFFSLQSLKWVLLSALGQLMKVTFMDFLALGPLMPVYLRLMGCKVGHGVLINTKNVHDVDLLEIGDGAVLGGEATMSCHAAEKGKLIFRPIKIGRKALIGQRSILMPGCEIGDGAVIGAQAMVLKNEKVPAGETWVGIPARRLLKEET